MTLQERIAKAIYENRNGRGTVAWAHRSSEHKRPYMEDARVALEVMEDARK